jgi:prevent-host-death family protein
MATVMNVHEAKTHLSKLLEAVERGEEVTIARAGVPVAKLVPVVPREVRRKPGALKGQIWMSDDFDDPMPEIEDAIYGPDPLLDSKP